MPTPTTLNRGYQKPDPLNYLDEDVLRIVAALDAIDVDIASLFSSMSGKASASHGHVINDIAGLQAALDDKLSTSATFTLDSLTDVNVAASNDGMFMRKVSGVWIGVALDGSMIASGTIPGARLGSHSHAISDVTGLQTALDGKQPLGFYQPAGSYAALAHTHSIANVVGLQTALDAKLDASAIFGKQTLNIPAGSMTARTTNGAAAIKEELATNDVMIVAWAFDPNTSEAVQSLPVRMPKGWDEGTVEVEFQWKHPATSTNFGVRWGARARAFSNDDALDAAFGTAQEVTDTGGTTNDLYITGFTSALTIGGTPVEGNVVIFEFYRDPANAGDTMAVDAHLIGVTILYTINAAKDD